MKRLNAETRVLNYFKTLSSNALIGLMLQDLGTVDNMVDFLHCDYKYDEIDESLVDYYVKTEILRIEYKSGGDSWLYK